MPKNKKRREKTKRKMEENIMSGRKKNANCKESLKSEKQRKRKDEKKKKRVKGKKWNRKRSEKKNRPKK